MTLRQLFRECVVALRRQQDTHDARVMLAWEMAALQRQKELPKLETLLTKRRKAMEKQTRPQQVTVLNMLSARLGIPLQRKRMLHIVRKDA